MTDVLSSSATAIPQAAVISNTTTVNETPVIKDASTEPTINGMITTNEKPTETVPELSVDEEPLFDPTLISPEILLVLPEGYTARPMRRSDYNRGYLDILRVLTTVGDISFEQWNERYDYLARRNDEYYMLVICDGTGKIVGTGSLIVERKFIHALGLVGHIEDIAVATDQQGKKLGLRIIQALDYVAAKVGCYKSILDCSEVNEGFYLKCGFRRAGLEMAHYY